METFSIQEKNQLPEDQVLKKPFSKYHRLWFGFLWIFLSVIVLFLIWKPLWFSVQSSNPVALKEASKQVHEKQRSVYTSFSGPLDLLHALKIRFPGKESDAKLFPVWGTDPPLFLMVTDEDSLQFPWTGELTLLSSQKEAHRVVLSYQELWNLRRIETMEFQNQPNGFLVFPLSLLTQQDRNIKISKDSMIRIDRLFPDEIRILLKKNEYPNAQKAKKEVCKLGIPHGPAVETESGYGFVLHLPTDEGKKNQIIRNLQKLGYPLKTHRIETYHVLASEIEISREQEGFFIPGPQQLKQPTMYHDIVTTPLIQQAATPLQDFCDTANPFEMKPESQKKTMIPFSNIQAIYVNENMDLTMAQILHVGKSPIKTRLWVWPLAGFCFFIVIGSVISVVRFLIREKDDSSI